jgi:hypothetical protein
VSLSECMMRAGSGTMVAEEIVDVPPLPSYAHGELIVALGAALYPYLFDWEFNP